MRLIFTFATLHQVLAAEKALRLASDPLLRCRPTPTPPGLSHDICGMSLELLDPASKKKANDYLEEKKLEPRGMHELAD